jgi:hypothetical protein
MTQRRTLEMSILQVLLGGRNQATDGIKLSRIQWAYNNSRSSKRVCFEDRRPTAGDHHGFSNQRILVHQWLGAKTASTIG